MRRDKEGDGGMNREGIKREREEGVITRKGRVGLE